jgi:hypothetical protein
MRLAWDVLVMCTQYRSPWGHWPLFCLFTGSGVGLSTPHVRRHQSSVPTQEDSLQAPCSALSHATGSSYYATPSPPVHSSVPLHSQPQLSQTSDSWHPSVLPPTINQPPPPPHQGGNSKKDFDVYDRIEQLSRCVSYCHVVCSLAQQICVFSTLLLQDLSVKVSEPHLICWSRKNPVFWDRFTAVTIIEVFWDSVPCSSWSVSYILIC